MDDHYLRRIDNIIIMGLMSVSGRGWTPLLRSGASGPPISVSDSSADIEDVHKEIKEPVSQLDSLSLRDKWVNVKFEECTSSP